MVGLSVRSPSPTPCSSPQLSCSPRPCDFPAPWLARRQGTDGQDAGPVSLSGRGKSPWCALTPPASSLRMFWCSGLRLPAAARVDSTPQPAAVVGPSAAISGSPPQLSVGQPAAGAGPRLLTSETGGNILSCCGLTELWFAKHPGRSLAPAGERKHWASRSPVGREHTGRL